VKGKQSGTGAKIYSIVAELYSIGAKLFSFWKRGSSVLLKFKMLIQSVPSYEKLGQKNY